MELQTDGHFLFLPFLNNHDNSGCLLIELLVDGLYILSLKSFNSSLGQTVSSNNLRSVIID